MTLPEQNLIEIVITKEEARDALQALAFANKLFHDQGEANKQAALIPLRRLLHTILKIGKKRG